MRFKVACLLLAAALLGGCTNYVTSATPWFTAEDARGAPSVRSGWWMMVNRDCRFSVEAPSAAWPDCVKPLLVPPGDRLVVDSMTPGTTSGGSYVLVSGEPLIIQAFAKGDGKAEPPTADVYGYYGLKPRRHDRQGRIIAFTVWPAYCGPPEPRTADQPFRDTTTAPWPGLDVRDGGEGCTAIDVEALRDAVRRSARLGSEPGEVAAFRWLRDWRPGDQTREEWLASLAAEPH